MGWNLIKNQSENADKYMQMVVVTGERQSFWKSWIKSIKKNLLDLINSPPCDKKTTHTSLPKKDSHMKQRKIWKTLKWNNLISQLKINSQIVLTRRQYKRQIDWSNDYEIDWEVNLNVTSDGRKGFISRLCNGSRILQWMKHEKEKSYLSILVRSHGRRRGSKVHKNLPFSAVESHLVFKEQTTSFEGAREHGAATDRRKIFR